MSLSNRTKTIRANSFADVHDDVRSLSNRDADFNFHLILTGFIINIKLYISYKSDQINISYYETHDMAPI